MDAIYEILEGLGIYVIWGLVIAILIGFFVEIFNALCSLALAIGTYFLVPLIENTSNSSESEAIAWAWVVGLWVFFRFLPIIGAQITGAETHTYLIFGTLIEETDYSHIPKIIGLLALGSFLLAAGTAVLLNWAIPNDLSFFKYLICTILTIWGGTSFVKSFIR